MMIHPEVKQLLEELNGTSYGAALKRFMVSKKEEFGDILESESWEDTKGRQYVVTFIKELLAAMEKQTSSPTKPNGKNDYT